MPYEINLEGKVAVVTGASSGIGRKSAEVLALAGADLLLTARNKVALEELAQEITLMGRRVRIFDANITADETPKAISGILKKEFGRLDILVNSAGITGRDNFVIRLSSDALQEILATNLIGTIMTTGALLPLMSRSESGSIVNISSVVAAIGTKTQPAYGASKGGVEGFTRHVAMAYAERGIRANTIAFGAIDTPMLDMAETKLAGVKQVFIDQTPMKRLGTVEEAAKTVLFLASDMSSYMTGQVLHVNGGIYFNT